MSVLLSLYLLVPVLRKSIVWFIDLIVFILLDFNCYLFFFLSDSREVIFYLVQPKVTDEISASWYWSVKKKNASHSSDSLIFLRASQSDTF